MGNSQSFQNNNTKKDFFIKYYNVIPDIPDNRDILFSETKTEKTDQSYLNTILSMPKLNIPPESNIIFNIILVIYLYLKEENKEMVFPYLNYNLYNAISNTNMNYDVLHKNTYLSIRNCLKSLNKYGIYLQNGYVFDENQLFIKPENSIYQNAKKIKIEYLRINNSLENIISVLNENYLILFNFSVYNSFHSEKTQKTGYIYCPEKNEKMIGMRSGIIISNNQKREEMSVLIDSNKFFGEKGIGYIPHKYLEKNCTDFWIITKKIIIEDNNNKNNNNIILNDNSKKTASETVVFEKNSLYKKRRII